MIAALAPKFQEPIGEWQAKRLTAADCAFTVEAQERKGSTTDAKYPFGSLDPLNEGPSQGPWLLKQVRGRH